MASYTPNPTPLKAAALLIGYVRELSHSLEEIVEYVHAPAWQHALLDSPLGTLGDIMTSQIARENILIAKTIQQMIVHSGVEPARQSARLHKELAMVKMLLGMLANLPSRDEKLKCGLCQISSAAIDCCDRVDLALVAIDGEEKIEVFSRPRDRLSV